MLIPTKGRTGLMGGVGVEVKLDPPSSGIWTRFCVRYGELLDVGDGVGVKTHSNVTALVSSAT